MPYGSPSSILWLHTPLSSQASGGNTDSSEISLPFWLPKSQTDSKVTQGKDTEQKPEVKTKKAS